jgi:hypothetical protein
MRRTTNRILVLVHDPSCGKDRNRVVSALVRDRRAFKGWRDKHAVQKPTVLKVLFRNSQWHFQAALDSLLDLDAEVLDVHIECIIKIGRAINAIDISQPVPTSYDVVQELENEIERIDLKIQQESSELCL